MRACRFVVADVKTQQRSAMAIGCCPDSVAEINGDEITIHNVRNCDYRTETVFTPHWETRTVWLSRITGMDLAINYWGSPWIAHPIVSFQFADALPLCFSIETRKAIGQNYSALEGLYRLHAHLYCGR